MAKAKTSKRAIRAGSGNVFADIGLPEPEEHLVKAELVFRIAAIIRDRKLTQRDAAKLLSISQPDVSRLLRGNFRDYSLDRLLRLLMTLGRDVQIRVTPKPATAHRPSRLSVLAA
jgi:predicted XRE-type DNA-binding protein